MKTIKLIVLLCSIVLIGCNNTAQNFKIYPAPQGVELSDQYSVRVEGCDVPIYNIAIPNATPAPRLNGVAGNSDNASLALFDIDGKVNIEVTSPQEIESVKILPASYAINYTTEGNTLSFSIDEPMHLTVEINGEWHKSLHISAKPFEVDLPDPNDPNVIYFGAGVHDVTSIVVGDNQTLYVAGGAYLRFRADQDEKKVQLGNKEQLPPSILVMGENATIRGRGIIDGGGVHRSKRRYLILVQDSKNISIEGVNFFDSSHWTMPIKNSDFVHVDNICLTGWRGNSDGIDISNSRDVLVENSFLRTYDDLVVIKTFEGWGEAKNIHIRKCVLWNEIAHALSVGAEVCEDVSNVLFEDCDVIHDVGRETALRVYHCDSATISDVTFQDIRIEEARRLLSVWIGKTRWSHTPERGHIKNILFKNITATSAPIDPTLTGFQDATDWKPYTIKDQASIEIWGYDKKHSVDGVTFDNVIIDDTTIDSSAITVQNEFINNVDFF